MRSALDQLAARAAGLPARDIPADVVREARRRLLDGLGCIVGAVRARPVRSVLDAVGQAAGSATLAGDTRRASAAEAALANTTALRYLDFMDGHPGPYSCHPSLVIPAVLAVAEHAGATGAEVTRAIVLGYELDIRLQIGSGDPDITAHGWSGSTNLGLAVPFAIGGMLGLSQSQLASALAISTVHAPTLDASGRGQMAQSKACVDGVVSMVAVTATMLARGGLRGPAEAFEGKNGLVATLAGRYEKDIVLGPLNTFRILDTYTKYYNSVKCGQSAATAAIGLRPRLPDLDEIEGITVSLAERDWRNQSKDESARRRPGNRDTANHSVFYCVAAALVLGDLQAEQFESQHLSDPRIRQVIDRISLEPDLELTAYWPRANPASVEVRGMSGGSVQARTIYSPGHPRNPVTDEQLEAKFRSLAEPVLGADRATEVIGLVGQLETLPSIEPLMALLAGHP